MADQLVTSAELETFLQETLDADTATLLVELSTAKVQAACGQRLVQATSTFVIDVDMWVCDEYLPLPQWPVQSVASVDIDGEPCTDWLLRKQQLWRLAGWNVNPTAPTQVTVTGCVHGYPDGAQGLELARGVALSLAAAGYGNPSGIVSEGIDDYRVTYAEAEPRMQISASVRDMLRAAYGVGAYVTTAH